MFYEVKTLERMGVHNYEEKCVLINGDNITSIRERMGLELSKDEETGKVTCVQMSVITLSCGEKLDVMGSYENWENTLRENIGK